MTAVKYQVWQLDCNACGAVVSYGEDESSVPDACEDCGEPVESNGEDNES